MEGGLHSDSSDQNRGTWLHLLRSIIFVMLTAVAVATVPSEERLALLKLKEGFGNPGELGGWRGDPCADTWFGITCDQAQKTVLELSLPNRGYSGTIAPEVANLQNLQNLDLQGNSLTGGISDVLKLKKLQLLQLTRNQLTGFISSNVGDIADLERLSLDENQLNGIIPESLGRLMKCQHLHLNNNSFTGGIPSALGRMPVLIHLLLDNNNMQGEIPMEIGNISSLLILKLSGNGFVGGIPATLTNLANLMDLSIDDNQLTGQIPVDIDRMSQLMEISLHNNQLTGTIPAGIGQLSNLSAIDLSSNNLTGGIPVSLEYLRNLQALNLANNSLNGTIPPALGPPLVPGLFSVRLEANQLTGEVPNGWNVAANSTNDYSLYGTPICESAIAVQANSQLCTQPPGESETRSASSTPTADFCTCGSFSKPLPSLASQGLCSCVDPFYVTIRLQAPLFANFDKVQQDSLISQLAEQLSLAVNRIAIANGTFDHGRLIVVLEFYPIQPPALRMMEARSISSNLYGQKVHLEGSLGPYNVLNTSILQIESGLSSTAGFPQAAIIGIVICGLLLFVCLFFAGCYAHGQKKRADEAEHNPFPNLSITVGGDDSGGPALHYKGTRIFRLAEMKAATQNFSEKNFLGRGGYGRVYKGVLRDEEEEVAIKRLETSSHQGDREFSTEIALLSRLHHRNLVGLVGFCNEGLEQMLVYEFMSNGTLREYLSAKNGQNLTWKQRLEIAQGAASGLVYLHTLANPTVIHRDIKSANILLDKKLVAKVADFGLSKLAPEGDMNLVTAVKGTAGYLDPEYFLTNQLSEKSDVYSFGVVLLEIFTGRQPIVKNEHISTTVIRALEQGKLDDVVDPSIYGQYTSKEMKAALDVALWCTEQEAVSRPTMVEVAEQLGKIGGHASSSSPLPVEHHLPGPKNNLYRGRGTGTGSRSNQAPPLASHDFNAETDFDSITEGLTIISTADVAIVPR